MPVDLTGFIVFPRRTEDIRLSVFVILVLLVRRSLIQHGHLHTRPREDLPIELRTMLGNVGGLCSYTGVALVQSWLTSRILIQ